MFSNSLRLFAAALLLCGVTLLQGQNAGAESDHPTSQAPAPAAAPTANAPAAAAESTQSPKPQFFSGTVTALDKEHITVSRTLVGKAPETRIFAVTSSTKLAKSVKVKTKVTVRYQHNEDAGDVALEVQVRSAFRFPRAS